MSSEPFRNLDPRHVGECRGHKRKVRAPQLVDREGTVSRARSDDPIAMDSEHASQVPLEVGITLDHEYASVSWRTLRETSRSAFQLRDLIPGVHVRCRGTALCEHNLRTPVVQRLFRVPQPSVIIERSEAGCNRPRRSGAKSPKTQRNQSLRRSLGAG